MTKPFDGCKVREVPFSEVWELHRFFKPDGTGYTKSSHSSCYDDHGFEPIYINPTAIVFVKTK